LSCKTTKNKAGEAVDLLLLWWEKSKRDYPWRRDLSPYKVLIAEMMLQRTKADQVVPIYHAFLKKFPSPKDIVSAQPGEVEDFFRHLGLLWRANKMRMIGKVLVSRFKDRVPNSREELLPLPGVGEYVADAVLAFAYGKDVAVVDANVCRIIGRLFGIEPHGEARRDPRFKEIAQRMMPKGRPKEFNWAMIDLAALVCKSKNPKCDKCPLSRLCSYVDPNPREGPVKRELNFK